MFWSYDQMCIFFYDILKKLAYFPRSYEKICVFSEIFQENLHIFPILEQFSAIFLHNTTIFLDFCQNFCILNQICIFSCSFAKILDFFAKYAYFPQFLSKFVFFSAIFHNISPTLESKFADFLCYFEKIRTVPWFFDNFLQFFYKIHFFSRILSKFLYFRQNLEIFIDLSKKNYILSTIFQENLPMSSIFWKIHIFSVIFLQNMSIFVNFFKKICIFNKSYVYFPHLSKKFRICSWKIMFSPQFFKKIESFPRILWQKSCYLSQIKENFVRLLR